MKCRFKPVQATLMMLAALISGPSTATTWNVYAKAFNPEVVFYFDADDVVKQGDTVTLWARLGK